jgi:hypothetical protein
MLENRIVEEDAHANLCEDIEDGMDGWLKAMHRYDDELNAIDMDDDLLD